MDLHLKISGGLLITLSLIHVAFPRYFNWAREFNGVSLINRQMMYIHTLFIGLVLLMMGVLCLVASAELTSTPLGNKLALGFAVFWLIRLFIQFFGYSPMLWKGKRFETGVHIVFSLLWIYLSTVFLMVYMEIR